MSKRLLWSDLQGLKSLVATQNVVLLQSVAGLASSNQEHFKSNVDDKNYLLGVLDVLKRNTADIKVIADECDGKVAELLRGKNGPDTKVNLKSIIKLPKKDVVRTKDQIKFLSMLSDLQRYGEIVALTGSDLIIELTARLNVSTDIINDVVKTTEDYLGENDGSK